MVGGRAGLGRAVAVRPGGCRRNASGPRRPAVVAAAGGSESRAAPRSEGETPLERLQPGGCLETRPPSSSVMWCQLQQVTKTDTVSVHGNRHEVDAPLVGRAAELLYDPQPARRDRGSYGRRASVPPSRLRSTARSTAAEPEQYGCSTRLARESTSQTVRTFDQRRNTSFHRRPARARRHRSGADRLRADLRVVRHGRGLRRDVPSALVREQAVGPFDHRALADDS